MNKRWWMATGLGLVLALTACGQSKLVGSWTTSDPNTKMGMTYTFNADGTGSMAFEMPAEMKAKMGATAGALDKPMPFAWTLEGDKLTISPSAEGAAAKSLTGMKVELTGVSVEGDTLKAAMGSQTMTLKRKG